MNPITVAKLPGHKDPAAVMKYANNSSASSHDLIPFIPVMTPRQVDKKFSGFRGKLPIIGEMKCLDKPIRVEERWWKAGEAQKAWPAEFLRAHEATCVSACDRFLNANYQNDCIWMLSRGGRAAQAVLMYSKRTLFPVLDGLTVIPVPVFLRQFLLSSPVHAIHGLREDVSLMEAALYPLQYEPISRVDYYLMAYEAALRERFVCTPGLTLRAARESDYKALVEMQASYEVEEVAINLKRYRPELARFSLAHILEREDMLVAEYEGQLVGKINTNARSFTRRQLGGVYVKPSFRRMGVASSMIGAMVEMLAGNQTAISLYVRKSNIAAQFVYKYAGFRTVADYRISYIK
ncbi:MAG: GNAT family N-acetyltransferase [Spirochaetaceae bacterium]|nr:GNAT family N-acetyltransferase [Spirochaetaceae bacterium]